VTDAELESLYPFIDWRTPMRVVVPSVNDGIVCRFCVAHYGFSAANIDRTMKTEEQFEAHLASFHTKT